MLCVKHSYRWGMAGNNLLVALVCAWKDIFLGAEGDKDQALVCFYITSWGGKLWVWEEPKEREGFLAEREFVPSVCLLAPGSFTPHFPPHRNSECESSDGVGRSQSRAVCSTLDK